MFKISLFSAALLLSVNAANAATFTIIDDFSTSQAEIETDVSTFPAGVGASVAGPGILGGRRGMRVVSRQAGNGFYTSSAVTNDVLVFSNSALDAGAVKLGYGGGAGLGGLDLTSGGQATEFVFDLISSDLKFGVLVRAEDTANNVSTLRSTLPGRAGSPSAVQLAFSGFSGSADLTDLHRLSFSFFNGSGDLDFVIDDITTAGIPIPTPTPSPSPVPLPAGGLLLAGALGALKLRGFRKR